MEFSIDRLKHCIAVAEKMKRLSEENSRLFVTDPEDMYVLGMVHDIGYPFVEEQKDHAKVGGEILKKQGYMYWREVYYHGIFQNEYDSPELRLLNFADITTGPSGEDMTMQQRIDNISERYGADSPQTKEAEKLLKMLSDKTF